MRFNTIPLKDGLKREPKMIMGVYCRVSRDYRTPKEKEIDEMLDTRTRAKELEKIFTIFNLKPKLKLDQIEIMIQNSDKRLLKYYLP